MFTSRAYGAILTEADLPVAQRLRVILEDTLALLREHRPDHAVVEQLYFSTNRKTAGGVYQARGVILAACGLEDIAVLEPGPGQVKLIVTGSGRADKSEIIRMVERLLGIAGPIEPDDTADALAAGIAGVTLLQSPLARQNGTVGF